MLKTQSGIAQNKSAENACSNKISSSKPDGNKSVGRVMGRQKGAVLITTIVLMVIFTLLGVAAMRTNLSDISIQASLKNRNNAFQCAEAALRAGEIWLGALAAPAFAVTANPDQNATQVWQVNEDTIQNPELRLNDFWQNNAVTQAYGGLLQNGAVNVGCKNDPRYFIEALGAITPDSDAIDFETQARARSVMYRITAYSTGIDDTATVVLQTTYLQPIN